MTSGDWLIILAVISGPILAVQIQKRLEDWREKKRRKLFIFETLMTTRGNTVSERHVEALNVIDLEFSVKKPKEKEVVDSWKVYRDHLHNAPHHVSDPSYLDQVQRWKEKTDEFLIDLLFEMSRALDYDFDLVQLKRGCYTPQGHLDYETENRQLRHGLLRLLGGHAPLKVEPYLAPAQGEDSQKSEAEGDGD